MTEPDHRQVGRDSLFMMADLRLDGQDGDYRVRVRNLSAGGMMAEGSVRVANGMRVDIRLRHVGWVAGTVAWIQDSRFGIAFVEPIDPKLVREPCRDSPPTITHRAMCARRSPRPRASRCASSDAAHPAARMSARILGCRGSALPPIC